MPDTKFSLLTPVTTPQATDEFAIVDALDATYKATLTQIREHLNAGSLVQIGATQSISTTVSSVDFDGVFDGTYDTYILEMTNVTTSAAANLNCRFDEGGALQIDNYYYHRSTSSSAAITYSGTQGTNTSEIYIAYSTTGANDSISGRIIIHSPSDTSVNTIIQWLLSADQVDGFTINETAHGIGLRNSTVAVDGIRIYPTTNSIDGGEFTLYGVAK